MQNITIKKLISLTVFAIGFFTAYGNVEAALPATSLPTIIPIGISTIPTVTSISPTSGTLGQTITVHFYGTNFSNNGIFKPTADFGTDITINYTRVVNSTEIISNITIPNNANIGQHNATITIGNQTTSPQIFTVQNISGGGGGASGGGSGWGGHPIFYVNVITQNATNTTKDSSLLNASVNPNGNNTTVWFEYGTSYNLTTFAETNHVYVGSNSYTSNFSQIITNLNPNTTYYYRAVGNNYAGTIRGNIFYVTTQANTTYTGANIENENTEIIDDNYNSDPIENIIEPKNNTDYFSENNLSANALFGFSDFFPKTFTGWIIFIILILLIIIIARKIYEDYLYQKERHTVDANHIENLPVH